MIRILRALCPFRICNQMKEDPPIGGWELGPAENDPIAVSHSGNWRIAFGTKRLKIFDFAR
jgi:hypothetical protein